MRHRRERAFDCDWERVLDVHDDCAELKEFVRGNRLSEEVGGIVISLDERNDELMIVEA